MVLEFVQLRGGRREAVPSCLTMFRVCVGTIRAQLGVWLECVLTVELVSRYLLSRTCKRGPMRRHAIVLVVGMTGACAGPTKAGLAGRLVRDLRRSAARDFRRAGVSEGEIMKLCGWKTRAMFDRYNIIDAADLRSAIVHGFNANQRQTIVWKR